MKHWRSGRASRRGIVGLALAGLAFVLTLVSSPSATGQELPAPSCTPGVLTPAQTAGPFYKSGAPERTSLLEPGMAGTKPTASPAAASSCPSSVAARRSTGSSGAATIAIRAAGW